MGIYEALPTCSGMPGGYDDWKAREPSPDPAERDSSMSRGRRGPGGLSADERRAVEVAERCVWCLGEGPEEPCSEACEREAVMSARRAAISRLESYRKSAAGFAVRYRREGDRRGSPRIVALRSALATTRVALREARAAFRAAALAEVSR